MKPIFKQVFSCSLFLLLIGGMLAISTAQATPKVPKVNKKTISAADSRHKPNVFAPKNKPAVILKATIPKALQPGKPFNLMVSTQDDRGVTGLEISYLRRPYVVTPKGKGKTRETFVVELIAPTSANVRLSITALDGSKDKGKPKILIVDVSAAIAKQKQAKKAEAARQQAEALKKRKANEAKIQAATRKKAEIAKQQAEALKKRKAAEIKIQAAAKKKAEAARQQAEALNKRKANEAKIQAAARKKVEIDRQQAEALKKRKAAESKIQATARKKVEIARQQAEAFNKRKAAEIKIQATARKKVEIARQRAEALNKRKAADVKMQSAARKKVEIARQQAEALNKRKAASINKQAITSKKIEDAGKQLERKVKQETPAKVTEQTTRLSVDLMTKPSASELEAHKEIDKIPGTGIPGTVNLPGKDLQDDISDRFLDADNPNIFHGNPGAGDAADPLNKKIDPDDPLGLITSSFGVKGPGGLDLGDKALGDQSYGGTEIVWEPGMQGKKLGSQLGLKSSVPGDFHKEIGTTMSVYGGAIITVSAANGFALGVVIGTAVTSVGTISVFVGFVADAIYGDTKTNEAKSKEETARLGQEARKRGEEKKAAREKAEAEKAAAEAEKTKKEEGEKNSTPNPMDEGFGGPRRSEEEMTEEIRAGKSSTENYGEEEMPMPSEEELAQQFSDKIRAKRGELVQFGQEGENGVGTPSGGIVVVPNMGQSPECPIGGPDCEGIE